MLSCKEMTEIATDYLEEDLPWRMRMQARLHLWLCVHCRTYMSQMRGVIWMMGQLPVEPFPPTALRRLLPSFKNRFSKTGL